VEAYRIVRCWEPQIFQLAHRWYRGHQLHVSAVLYYPETFCFCFCIPQGLAQLEGLGKLIKLNYLIGSQTSDLPASSMIHHKWWICSTQILTFKNIIKTICDTENVQLSNLWAIFPVNWKYFEHNLFLNMPIILKFYRQKPYENVKLTLCPQQYSEYTHKKSLDL
jgi:hypothetical protein